MSNALSPIPYWQETDTNGKPYSAGLLYTYYAGTNNPKDTQDINGDTNTNPVRCDSAGRLSLRLLPGAYDMVFTDGFGATQFNSAIIEGIVVWTATNVADVDADSTFIAVDSVADMVSTVVGGAVGFVLCRGYASAGDGGGGLFYWDAGRADADGGVVVEPGSEVEPGMWVRQYNGYVNPRWWGAKFDGSTNDSTAFQSAVDYADAASSGITLSEGVANLTVFVDFSPNGIAVPIEFGKAILKWSGFTPEINPQIPITDTDRHFQFGTGDEPSFPEDSEIKNIWLDGVTTGWYQTSLATSIDLTTVSNNLLTLSSSVDAIEASVNLISPIVSQSQADIVLLQADVIDLQEQIDAFSTTTLITGKFPMIFDKSLWNPAVARYANCHYELTTVVQPTVIDVSSGWTGGGSVTVTVNSTGHTQAYNTSKDNSLTLLAALISSNENVAACGYFPSGTANDTSASAKQVLMITPVTGTTLTVSITISGGVAGGLTMIESSAKTISKNVRLSVGEMYGIGASGSGIYLSADGTPIPSAIRPDVEIKKAITVYGTANDGVFVWMPGCIRIATTGAVQFYRQYNVPYIFPGTSGFEPDYNKGFPAFTVEYPIEA